MVRTYRAEKHFIGQFEGRIKFLVLAIICAFLFLILILYKIQIIQGDWFQELARNNRVRKLVIPAPRGNIYDRKGVILADNRPSFNVEVIIEDVPKNKKDEIADNLSSILEIPKERILKKINLSRRVPYVPEIIVRDIDIETVSKIQEHREQFPGINIHPIPLREYKFKAHASHVIGYIGKISSSEYQKKRDSGYDINDYIGKMGIEKITEDYLKGTHGGMQVQVDNRGYLDKVLGVKEPVPGNHVYLTIDHHLQEYVERLLPESLAAISESSNDTPESSGAIIVMNVKNGNILAMASLPNFDPNLFVKPTSPKIITELFQSERKYLINKSIREVYPPGSTYKMLIGIAALESGGLTVADKYFCNGNFEFGKFTFHCWYRAGHGKLSIIEALRYSCNVFFYNVGSKILGIQQIHHWNDDFGFGQKTGIDLDGEEKGVNPGVKWKKKKFNLPWYPGDTVNISIGQGYMLVTPVQLACYVSAIANEGTLFKPNLIDKIVSNNGTVIKSYKPVIRKKIDISPQTIKIIKQGMKEVVQHQYGTGQKARVKNVLVSGKTGTIQMGTPSNRIHHAWFTGFAPSDDPEIAFVILVEHGTSGGTYAAPIASKIVDYYFNKLKYNGQSGEQLQNE